MIVMTMTGAGATPPPPPAAAAGSAIPHQNDNNASATAMIISCLSTIVSYPSLYQHEESLSTATTQAGGTGSLGAYDVMAWISYLESIDDVLEILKDGLASLIRNASSKKKKTTTPLLATTLQAGGRTFHISSILAPGITHTIPQFTKEIQQLLRARRVVGERSVSLLPGSYKLWKNHLGFCANLLLEESIFSNTTTTTTATTTVTSSQEKNGSETTITTSTIDFQSKYNQLRLPSYLFLHSNYNYYQTIVSAYERALVRLHKMPTIWLQYASIVAIFDPERNPTTVRKIYDRALIELPASQHDRIWEDYICWVTGVLPSSSSERRSAVDDTTEDGESSWKDVSRKGYHKVKYGFETPLIAHWRKRGWGYRPHSHQHFSTTMDDDSKKLLRYVPTVPAESALRILRRYAVCYDTTFREDLATLCITRYGRYGEAASLLLQLLNNEQQGVGGGEGAFMSPNGTTRHELWLRFADVCTGHPNEAKLAGVDFDGIIRAVLRGQDRGTRVWEGGGVGGEHTLGFEVFDRSESASGNGGEDEENQRHSKDKSSTPQALDHHLGEMEGTLWTRLAEYHVRGGDFELARSVYEEALDAITRVRDFSLVFDAYVKFEEGVIEALMELMEEEEEGGEGEDEDENGRHKNETTAKDNEDLDILLGDSTIDCFTDSDNAGSSVDVDLAISRAEHLTSRRPLLLNRVLLRQNPHNIGEWIKRSQLYLDLGEVDMAASALEESLKSVSAHKAVNGSPCTLVLTLIDILENRQKNIDSARNVLERICTNGEYDFQDADDLAQCHASWVELELRQENWDMALNLARRAVAGNVGRKGKKAARGLSRILRLWNLLFDLEESLGTVQTTKDAYDRALEIKVATPSHVLNYAAFLKEKKYFEESFAAYERGISLFPFPHAGATLLWKSYLRDFLERYDGSKTPRARELFDRCIADCPSEESPEFFLLYGNYEETHGLTKRALGVYERMCTTVPSFEKYTAYRLYIAKAIQYLGVTSARPIYEAAISALEDGPASHICLEYAKMETGLREVDRARTVLVYGAQLADPRRDPDYWKAWHEFEVSYGNEETFREMLRVKRSVQAAFSTVNYNAAEMGAGTPQVETLTDDTALEMIAEREGVIVEKKPLVGGFVQSKKRTADMADLVEVERRAARLREVTAAGASNGGDEIDIDEEEEDSGPARSSMTKHIHGVSEKAIPAAVFGGLTTTGN